MIVMSRSQAEFAVFRMPVLEFPITKTIQIDDTYNMTLMGYVDIFGNYFDMSMFSGEIISAARKKRNKYKMSQMQIPSKGGQDTETMSGMYQ